MKLFRLIIRSFRDAFRSVVRNFSLSLASISCITITLIIVGFSMIISNNVQNFTYLIEKDVTIVVFLDNNISEEEIKTVESKILGIDNINDSSLHFKSKAAIKEEMQETSETFESILSEWDEDENPLKDTYTVKVNDINKIKDTVKSIRMIPKVNTIQYGEGLVDNLIQVFDTIEKVTIVCATALIVVTLFLIINTIKITIFSRQEEIGIMRLVGASNIRIKMPFVIEGIVLGIIGSIIPIAIIVYGYVALYNYFGGVLYSQLIRLIRPYPFVFGVAIIVLLAGVVVGMIGSSRAVRKYIKI